jgi:AmmeMemoRadiSam system protein B
VLVLRDRQGLTDQVAFVPPALAVLLGLCDGTRDLDALRVAYELRTGQALSPSQVRDVVAQLDSALMLQSPRFQAVQAAALSEYRAAAFRQPALAGHAYPTDPDECRGVLQGYEGGDRGDGGQPVAASAGDARGLVSPHIDYERGGPVYSRVWTLAAESLAEVDTVVVFGTDHHGSAGRMTLTRQHYATPFGVLETDGRIVDQVAGALGDDFAFDEELHHRTEHSIELAAVWLHYLLDGRACRLVPILCGSFHEYVAGSSDASADPRLEAALTALRGALAGRRALVVAAADLAHVGPAFGDERGFGLEERGLLRETDGALLGAICAGDAGEFLARVSADGDRWRVCGLPPIYLALRLLGGCVGQVVCYDQCPADQNGGSWVSVAGVVLR